ncbi:MAG: hypothetical protein H7070_07540 [Saprospiraceae bacterium]|nr:hypothetical protein [Pyrinomonadaceae bacterium]
MQNRLESTLSLCKTLSITGARGLSESVRSGFALAQVFAKKVEAVTLAFGAGSVAGGKGGGFVEEEEIGVIARMHYRVLPAFEFQYANDPPDALKLSPYLSALVVQASAVAVKRSPCRRRDQRTERCDTILLWHIPEMSVIQVYYGRLCPASLTCGTQTLVTLH